MGSVTIRDSKERIFAALQDANAKLAELRGSKVDFAGDAKAKKSAQTVQKAKDISTQSIEIKVANLTKDITTQLAKISASLTEQITEYTTVEEAISVKKQELEELLGMEAEALELAAIVNAKQDLGAQMDAENAKKLKEAQEQLAQIRGQIESERNTWDSVVHESRKALDQEQKRLRDEFSYNFNREKIAAHDKLNDELSQKRRSHDIQVITRSTELDKREEAVSAREVAVTETEDHLRHLEAEVASFPQRLDAEIAKAREAGKKEAEQTAAIKLSYAEKHFNNEKLALEKEIAMLKETLQTERQAHQSTHQKLEAANQRVQDIAISAVKGASESKVVLNAPAPQNLDGRR